MAYTTIDNPTQYFNTVLYTGDGNDGRTVTGVGFQPDWVWLKGRSEAEHHTLNDVVRGANKQIYSHLAYDEATDTDRLQSFDSDGFTLGTDVIVNKNSETFVSWNWKAGGSASSNSNGSITSSVSANTTTGLSIVTTTGTGSAATIGHGLGTAPAMIMSKRRDSGSSNWRIFNKNLSSNSHILFLDTTDAEQSGNSATWNNTAPTSTVFSVGASGDVNASSGTFVHYCFAEVKGYSKMGKYTGNGNADGRFVYTGFRPAWLMVKISSGQNEWILRDNKRDIDNSTNHTIYPNLGNAEAGGSGEGIDFLSNGFKLRLSAGSLNGNNSTYIYMAFAENPFVNSNGIPVNAR